MADLVPTAISLLGVLIAWLMADQKSKSRLTFLDERVSQLVAQYLRAETTTAEKLNALDIRISMSEQDRRQIHESIEKLESSKASRELLDKFRLDLVALRDDLDRRFDRLERLLEKKSVKD